MPKKKVKRRKSSSKSKTPIKDDKGKDRIISILVENTAEMQKAVVGLTEKLNKLANQINDLLALFEVTARSIAEKPELGFERDFTEKLNTLLEQNRVIARGISLISQQAFSMPQSRPAPQMRTPAPRPMPQSRPAPQMQQHAQAPRPTQPPVNVKLPPQTPPIPSPSEEYSASEYSSSGTSGEVKKPKPMPPAPSQQ